MKKNSKKHISKTNEKTQSNKDINNKTKGNMAKDNNKKTKTLTPEQKMKQKKIIKRVIIISIIIIVILLIMFCISLYKWSRIIKDITNCENSVIVDSTGNVIATLGESRIQEKVDLDDLPENLIDAYISIEDKNFYKHNGINIKRTIGATFSYITNGGSSSYGGSTITQQLVKNVTGENETKITRKVKEWDRALKTELVLSKDEILNTYLNIIYVGPNVYGVQMGSKYYFNKDVSELNLAECAFLAGINNSPNSYNPFGKNDNTEKIKIRTKTVLDVMKEEEYITKSEYEEALDQVENGLKFKKGDVQPGGDSVYSYLADATITDVISDLEKNKKMSTDFATNYLYLAGLKIYSTQNSDIQKSIEKECEKTKYMLKSSKISGTTSQAAMVIIDHENGKVVGCVGGLGEKTTSRGFNRVTQALRQTGSAIKPIAVLGPALEENIVTPITVYDDTLTTFAGTYTPKDCDKELGNITVRRAVESSQNIPFVKMMEQLTTKKSIKYMEKEGITTLTEGDNSLSLALGGLEKGISPLEMAAAYATIANDGVYIQPIFYTKVENNSGKVILKSKQKTKKVYSENTAYVLKELLTQPVKGENGTARSCSIDGMEVAAKTGTTNDNYDKWLCGFTTYYTGVTWFGYDTNETINEGADSIANHIWSAVMNNVHSDLVKSDFRKVKYVQEVQVCKQTGKIAGSGCNDAYTEYFRKNNVVKDVCNENHIEVNTKNNNTLNTNKTNEYNNDYNNNSNYNSNDYNTNNYNYYNNSNTNNKNLRNENINNNKYDNNLRNDHVNNTTKYNNYHGNSYNYNDYSNNYHNNDYNNDYSNNDYNNDYRNNYYYNYNNSYDDDYDDDDYDNNEYDNNI